MIHFIKNERKKQGISQEQLADQIGVDRGTIVNFERNYTSPRLSHLVKISSVLGIRLQDLLSLEHTPPQSAA